MDQTTSPEFSHPRGYRGGQMSPPDAEPGRCRPADPRTCLVEARGVGVRRGERWLVRNVDLEVRRGEIVTLIGPNGSGKSTTAKAVLGLLALDEGSVARARKIRVGYVPQRLSIDQTLPLTVSRLMTLTGRRPPDEINRALERVGLGGLACAGLAQLSGGEFQRALLARAILCEPDLLVLDEPVQGVDFAGEIALYDLIRDIRDRLDCGVLLISHDLHIVMAATDTVICLSGHVCCSGPPQTVLNDPEYLRLFGPQVGGALAIYRHEHDHTHGVDGAVLPLDAGDHPDGPPTGHGRPSPGEAGDAR